MKAMSALLLASAIFRVVPVHAESTIASPLIGHWALDVSKLPMPPKDRPKSVTVDFRGAADGKWSTRVEIVDQSGNTMHGESMLSLDGTPGQATGNYCVDACAAKMPAPDVLVMQFAYEGKPASTRIYSVNADGTTLTETRHSSKKMELRACEPPSLLEDSLSMRGS